MLFDKITLLYTVKGRRKNLSSCSDYTFTNIVSNGYSGIFLTNATVRSENGKIIVANALVGAPGGFKTGGLNHTAFVELVSGLTNPNSRHECKDNAGITKCSRVWYKSRAGETYITSSCAKKKAKNACGALEKG